MWADAQSIIIMPASYQVCWTKYGSYPIHRPYCHEAALRILLSCLESHANRYKRYIVPLLSVHMDFYIRVRLAVEAPLVWCTSG
jgi:tRNA (guanine26-N2/guanine27-N2)-dimethyltransferase